MTDAPLIPGAVYASDWCGYEFNQPVPIVRRSTIREDDVIVRSDGTRLLVTGITKSDTGRYSFSGHPDCDLTRHAYDESTMTYVALLERDAHQYGRLAGTEPAAPMHTITITITGPNTDVHLYDGGVIAELIARDDEGLVDTYFNDPTNVTVTATTETTP